MLNKLVFKKNALVPSINVYIFCIVATKKLSSCKLAVFHLYSILIQCTVECLKKSADFKVIAVCKNYPYMFCWKSVLFGNHGCINAGNHGCINAGNHGCINAGNHGCINAGNHGCINAIVKFAYKGRR